MIGKSEKLISSTIGSSASAGRSGCAASTFSLTRWSAKSMSTFGWNSMVITEAPSAESEAIFSTSRSPLSSFSIGIVRSVSTSPGETPG